MSIKAIKMNIILLLTLGTGISLPFINNDSVYAKSISNSINSSSVFNSPLNDNLNQTKLLLENDSNSSNSSSANSNSSSSNLSSAKSSSNSSSSSLSSAKSSSNSSSSSSLSNDQKQKKSQINLASSSFNLTDWSYSSNGSKTTLTNYVGSNPNITIPGSYVDFYGNTEKVYVSPNLFQNSDTTNIKSVTFQSVNGQDVQVSGYSLSNFFAGMSSLQSVDLSGLDTSQVFDFSSMFANCPGLQNVNLDSNNFSQSTTMDYMFQNDRNLLEVKMNNIGPYTDISYMFNNCGAVYVQLLVANGGDLEPYNTFKVPSYLPLLVYTNAPSLLGENYTYNSYGADSRVPSCIANSQQGLFGNYLNDTFFDTGRPYSKHFAMQKLSFYVRSNLAFATDQDPEQMFSTAAINQWLDTTNPYPTIQGKMPPKKDPTRVFCGFKDPRYRYVNVSQSRFNTLSPFLQSVYAAYDAYYGPLNPNAPKAHTVNQKNPAAKKYPDNRVPIGSELGIAYQPTELDTGATAVALNDGDQQQTVPLSNGNVTDFHIAIRNYLAREVSWTLSGQLTWNRAPSPDSYISVEGSNSININTNNGKQPFNSNQLSPYSGYDVTAANSGSFNITTFAPIQIMQSDGSQPNNCYDFDLGKMAIVIPNASQANVGNCSGNINWNLSNAPMGSNS